jgi:hypothetical protein
MVITLEHGEDRVRNASTDEINQKIDREILGSIHYYATQDAETIQGRICQLDKEWDMDRILELNASLISFGGVLLAAAFGKKWLILPMLVTGFLARHAIEGWCPPIPVLRKLGVRTQKEIDTERHALLKLLER